jgi:hypothetical protein
LRSITAFCSVVQALVTAVAVKLDAGPGALSRDEELLGEFGILSTFDDG